MSYVLRRRTVRRLRGSWRTPSVDTGSERSHLGAHSEEGSRQQLAQTEGPGALTTQTEKGRGQWAGSHSREWREQREWRKLTQLGIKRGQIQKDAGPWQSVNHAREKEETPAVKKELKAPLVGGPEASWLCSAIPQSSGRLTNSLPKRAIMP